jgi:DNA-binding MarR family transcriptional regulator
MNADGRYSLPALLSHALVAFTIEFDNEFERRVPHRTTDYGGTRGAPWLVSMVLWAWILRFVVEDGITVGELGARSRCSPKALQNWLTRLEKWWGYVVIEPATARGSGKRYAASAKVRPTAGGSKALAAWRPLTALIEGRWKNRFGARLLKRLCTTLSEVTAELDPALPSHLPVLGYGLMSSGPETPRPSPVATDEWEVSLPALLSKALLAYALEFEREAGFSLAIGANFLRLTDDEGTRVRDLPRRSGASREAIAMATSFLTKRGYARVETRTEGAGKAQVLLLSAKGRHERQAYFELVDAIEKRWEARIGETKVRSLREALEALAGETRGSPSRLLKGLLPHPDGWRASAPALEVLPDFPMVLHRGGFPDGS